MMKPLVVILGLVILAPPVSAGGDLRPYLGVVFANSKLAPGQSGISDGLYNAGVEVRLYKGLFGGLSTATNDSQNELSPQLDLKIDGYLKYLMFDRAVVSPFLAAGLSGVVAERQECGYYIKEHSSGFAGYKRCYNESFWSGGASYQAGVELGQFRDVGVDLYWEQYFGSQDVRVNSVVINANVSF